MQIRYWSASDLFGSFIFLSRFSLCPALSPEVVRGTLICAGIHENYALRLNARYGSERHNAETHKQMRRYKS